MLNILEFRDKINKEEGDRMKKNVLVAMSGGVDSAVCAYLLCRDGFDCTGVTLKLFDGCDIGCANELCFENDISDAKKICQKLNIPHEVLELKDKFKKYVISSFVESYLSGLTPNPCIECNRHIKFTSILDAFAKDSDTKIATGHYANVVFDKSSGRYLIKKAQDLTKDQSYVLYSLSQETLSKVIFPLGNLTKDEARSIALDNGFVNARKKDSQDICFIKDGNYRKFLEFYTGSTFDEGDFILPDGKVIARHKGLPFYTIGQRKGLGIAYEHPLYVISKDREKNAVIVGNEDLLFQNKVIVDKVNLIAYEKLISPIKASAKLRYAQKESECVIHPLDEKSVLLEFDEPQRAVTPGQSAVFYDGEFVIGGGEIGANQRFASEE